MSYQQIGMPQLNQTTIQLPSALVLTVTARWLGLEGDQDEVYNKYLLTVDNSDAASLNHDVTVEYKYLAPLPERGNRMRKRLSVQELAQAFWEMLESALLVDPRLLERLEGLDIDRSGIPAIMAELKEKYNLY